MAEVKKPTKAVLKNKKVQFAGTGRRKLSVARVRLIPNGTGKIEVNGIPFDEYFKMETLKLIALQSLTLTDTTKKYDIFVNVYGGGISGQAGAMCHGISRALIKAEENLKPEIKKAGLLTRDSRMKERKKYGLKKARKASQFSKR